MKKILGLDLGTNSIGWALIDIDDNGKPIRIVDMGARIIPLNTDDKSQFEKGQSISKNQDRTRARTQRKGYDRKQLKKSDDFKYSLKKELEKYNIFPSDDLLNLPQLDLWEMRSTAVSEPIDAKQLGRILYMLNQKRGYKSARSEANADKKDTDYVAEVKSRFALIKEKNQTIGQYFYSELKNNAHYRVKEQVFPREAYIEEFDTIINTQRKHHDFLTDEVIHRLRNEIIYYQRKLKSQKGLVSVCEFEGFDKKYFDPEKQQEVAKFVGPKVAPKTSPIFQLCKIWEVVNNITLKVKNPEGSKYKWRDYYLSIEEKEKVARHLSTNATLTYTDLLKILDLKKDQVYANKQIQKGIQGNVTYAEIYKILGESDWLKFNVSILESDDVAMLIDKKTGEILEERNRLIVHKSFENEPLYQLWHTIYSIKDLEECKLALVKRFNFDDDVAEKLARIDFNKQAFGNKSAKAIRKILPYLMYGYDYSQACSLAGYNHSNSLTTEEKAQRVVKDKLDLLPKNSLRQPVVEKIINQMINVVNAVIDTYGKPYEIRVELARELKQSKDERDAADKANSNNKKQHEYIAQKLEELGLPTTKKYIQKYKFIFPAKDKKWKEANVVNQCIYCGEIFNLTEALAGDNYDVDHIVPKALLFDDSQTNKVLVHRKCNANKTNTTAYDYIASKGESALNEYLQRVDDWFARGVLSYGKMQRLKVSYKEYLERKKQGKTTEADKKLWESFIDRQLRETQYIAKKSKQILEQICNNVTVTEGGVTAHLRKVWGWNDVLMNLQLPKYRALNQTQWNEWTSEHGKRVHKKEEIMNWTKRDDHRHHAIDALVVACTKQGFIQRINTLNASEVKDEMQKEIEVAKIEFNEKLNTLDKYLITQKPFSTQEVEQEASKILISFKAGKKVATISKYKAKGINKEKGVIVPRGALHEAGLYGIRTLYGKGGIAQSHVIKKYKVGVSAQDHIFSGKETYKEKIDKNGKIVVEDKIKVVLDSIVDNGVRKSVLNRLNYGFEEGKDYRSDVKKALNNFKNIEENPLWFNQDKGIKIRSIKMKTGLQNSVVPVRIDNNEKVITLVKTGNNHHIAIYEDDKGKLVQHTCTFWHAVERKKFKLPIIVKDSTELWNGLLEQNYPEPILKLLPPDGLKLKFSMQQNEMFVLGLADEEFDDAIKNNDKVLLSKHLYLVWSIADGDYWFRHHLETKNSELKKITGAKDCKRYYRLSLKSLIELNPHKIRLNHIGEINYIGE